MLQEIDFDTEMLSNCNITTVKCFPCNSDEMPEFFVNFNKCKTKVDRPDSDNIFKEILWGNEMFKHKDVCMYMKNWINSGIIYVKDLIYEEKLLNEEKILSVLKQKTNWIAEFTKVKNVVRKRLKNVDLKNARFVNIIPNMHVYFVNRRFADVTEISNKEIYNLFVHQKFQRPRMEHVWCKEFGLERFQFIWQDIYITKVKNMPFQNIKEFNYKLITNTVIAGNIVSLWNKDVSPTCDVCKKVNTVKHMLFECERVLEIWQHIGEVIRCKIDWKKIVIGIKGENNISLCYNIMISSVAYAIYTQWIKHINGQTSFQIVNLFECCKYALIYNSSCLVITSLKLVGLLMKKLIKDM
jgi:hypothetical protein